MKPWATVPVPLLPGRGGPVRVHDTATGALRTAAPGTTARLYVCGITPYDATHLGHAATYLAFDLLGRAWHDAGQQVRYVQNVTDVDDPLLERAAATGEDWRALAERETALFATDMASLRVLPPDVWVGAVEAIPRIVTAVEAMLAGGGAYHLGAAGAAGADGEGRVGEGAGDVYAAVSADEGFGRVAHLDAATARAVFAERGGDPDRPGKRDPLDALLWRAERAGEPAWDGASLGPGRPGWHVECAVIARDHLGGDFDVQGGGSDLVFPHHEMSASHDHVLHGGAFARTYAHAGMVGLDGVKMSKSLGNLVLVSRLRAEGVDPMAVRLAVLAHHYRHDWSWTAHGLVQAQERLVRWRGATGATSADPTATAHEEAGTAAAGEPLPQDPAALTVLAAVRERLADDLDAPGALDVVDAWARDNAGGAPGGALVARAVDALLGVDLTA